MGEVVTHRNVPIDATSRAILGALADSDARATASQLRLTAGLADPHQVRYRIDQYLLPAGLVEPLTTDGDGETVYALTEEGREFLDDHGDDLEASAVSVVAGDASSGAGAPAIENPMDRLADHEDAIDSFGTRITRLEGRVNDLGQRLERTTDRLEETREGVQDVAGRIDDVADELAELERRVEQLAEESEAARELVVQRVRDAMEDREQAFRNEMQRVRERIKELEEDDDGGFL